MVKIQKYLDKDENTRYKFRYYAGVDELTGKQRYIRRQGFTSEEDAKNELLKIEYLVKTNQYFKDVKSGKFGDVLDEWLTLHKTRVKASTYHIIETRVTKYVRPYFNDMYVDKITVRHCQDFVSKAFVTTPKGYVYLISIVKNTLDYALRLGMIESNPMLYVIKPKKQATISDKHDNFYNKDELKKFLEVAKYYNQEKYTIFRLLAYSGIRIGECLALTWHDLDYKNNTITINKTLARTDKGITIQTPKTKASNRVISLDVETIQILKSWQLEQRKQLLKIGINSMNKHQLIFNSNKNSFIFSSVITYDIKQIAKKAGIHPITSHGFRHTHATLLFASGMDIKQVQARLGRSKVQTTLDVYTHTMKDKQNKIGDEFARYVDL